MAKFVTTMAQKQLDTLGKHLFDSWEKYSGKEKLTVFVDKPEAVTGSWKNVEFLRIENPKYYEFLEKYRGDPNSNGNYNGSYEYRLDTVRFCHKIYAIYEGLRYLTDTDKMYIWWDADAWLTDKISQTKLDKLLGPIDWLAASLGRKDWDHSETGIMVFNLQNERARPFIESMVNLYDSGNIFKLSQGRTDSFVYDVVKAAYEKKLGEKFKNISEGVPGSDVWPHTVLAEFSEHAKGPEAKTKVYKDPSIQTNFQPGQQTTQASVRGMMSRYDQIFKLIDFTKPKIITEVGVARGDRAEQMIRTAAQHTDRVVYFGFDIFEDGDEELNQKEMNGKKVSSMDKVNQRLTNLQKEIPNLFFKLYKGNTNETLPAYASQPIELTSNNITITPAPTMADLVFIDGGHSVETIRNDYDAFKDCKFVLLDDYYVADDKGRCPDITKFGCNFLEKELEVFKHLPVQDPINEGGFTKIIATGELARGINIKQPGTDTQAKSEAKIEESNTTLSNSNGKGVKIQTRNSIPNETLQEQVDYACRMMKEHNIPEVRSCSIHHRWAYLVGGSPSYKEPGRMSLIKQGAESVKDIVFTSKTAHDYLIDNGITPWGCLLLDPRPHVAEYFNVHPDVTYFVASQCHQDVFDKLIKEKAKVFVYHAEVAAGEKDIIKKHFPDSKTLAGGSTSQTRGISVLMLMGFYRFKLFGLDSSYSTQPEKVHGINQQKKSMEIEINNKKTKEKIGKGKYWTDPELIAQINDMEHITKIFGYLELENHSDGLMKDMLEYWLKDRKTFEQVYVK